MKKTLIFLLIAVMAFGMFALTGCGGEDDTQTEGEGDNAAALTDWEYIADKGELIVGLDDTFAPMGFRDQNNELVGFDIDLANAVGEKMGVAVTFKPIDWDAKDLELKAKTIDCIWNGMSATEERQETMQLTDKYLNNRIVILTLDKDVKITAAEDLANYTIATQVDSSALETMKANAAWESFGENVSEYKSYDEAILDLRAGRMDCVVIDQVLGEYKNSNMDGAMYVCDFDFGDDYYAIGCRKGEVELVAKINEAIQALIDDGSAAEISNKWFGKNIVMLEGYDQ